MSGGKYLHDATFDTVFNDKLDGLNWTMLTQSVYAVHGLCVRPLTTYQAKRRIHVRNSTAGFHQLSIR
jgi:hypothetical protein